MACHAPVTPIDSVYIYAFLFNGKWRKLYTNKPYVNIDSPFLKENAQLVLNIDILLKLKSVKSAMVHANLKYLDESGRLLIGIPPNNWLINLPDSSKAFLRNKDKVQKRKIKINFI